jgi:hypothetical protein
MKNSQSMKEVFNVFQNREEYFEKLSQKHYTGKLIGNQIIVIIAFTFLYGIVMGSYNSVLQAFVTGVKVPVLFTLSILICFPAFFVIQYILGSKLSFIQMTGIILSGFVFISSIMISFAPIVVFFLITGNNYAFLKLLHVAIFIFSGLFGIKTIIEALKYSCEAKNIYPKIGLNIFKFWVVILAFVGMQLAWNLRPFLGDKLRPFELFREREGNFYLAVIQSCRQLFITTENTPAKTNETENTGN